jgi:CHASE2 domain-containing sensor protein
VHAYKKNWPEYILFNLFSFAIILGFAFLFKTNLKVLHPIKKGLDDFSFTDIYYKLNKPNYELKKHPIPAQPELFVINIGTLNRQGLAEMVNVINKGNPSILSMDILFHEEADSAGTFALSEALKGSSSIIQGYICDDGHYCADGMHSTNSLQLGEEAFINLPGADPVNEAIRYFKPFHNKDVGLAVATALFYLEKDSRKLNRRQKALLKARKKEVEKCYSKKKYTIRYNRLLSHDYNNQFLDHTDLTHPSFDASVFKDKIVLLGYRGVVTEEEDNALPAIHPDIDEDMYFTPLNKNMTGRSYPDMYGVDIQANIISNVLNGNYVVKIKDLFSWMLAFFICLIFTPLMVFFFVKQHLWFHIVAKLLQLSFSIGFVLIGILVFSSGFYLNAKPILFSIILIVDLMYFYDAFVKIIARRKSKQGKDLHSVFLEGH